MNQSLEQPRITATVETISDKSFVSLFRRRIDEEVAKCRKITDNGGDDLAKINKFAGAILGLNTAFDILESMVSPKRAPAEPIKMQYKEFK